MRNESELRTALQQSIDHWIRMVAWVCRTRNWKPGGDVGVQAKDAMLNDLGEDWSGDFCALCESFECGETCPLETCGYGSIWQRVNRACTRKTWLKYAVQMEHQLIKLYREAK